jgi:hypothetical protein
MKHLYKILQLLKDRRFDKVCSRGSLSLRLLYLKGLSLRQRERRLKKELDGAIVSSTDDHRNTTGKVGRSSLSRLHEATAIYARFFTESGARQTASS